jgi:hypothetical protein
MLSRSLDRGLGNLQSISNLLVGKALGGNKYQLSTETLQKGDYIVYVVGSADFEKGIYGRGYDFTVY